jgi:hypothetical protein
MLMVSVGWGSMRHGPFGAQRSQPLPETQVAPSRALFGMVRLYA